MTSAFERAIDKIDAEISINKDLRQTYTKDFDIIRNHILKAMTETNACFKYMYNGPSLFGSYLENLKIDKPDEFDVHVVVKLPFNEKLQVTRDISRPGFVNLNISGIVKSIHSDPNLSSFEKTLDEITDDRYFISRYKLQDWFEKMINSVFAQQQSIRSCTGQMYKLDYSKRSTAHTIRAICDDREISVDLVPAFKFQNSEGLYLDRKFPTWVKEKLWFAVPKHMKGNRDTNEISFSVCAPQVERDLLINKGNLKRSLRLLKSLRDKMGEEASGLKSYLLKTIYLYEANRSHKKLFWNAPVGTLLIHMIDVLIIYLGRRKIKFYWSKRQNLLRLLSSSEIYLLRESFQRVRNQLSHFSRSNEISYPEIRALFDNPSSISVSAERMA